MDRYTDAVICDDAHNLLVLSDALVLTSASRVLDEVCMASLFLVAGDDESMKLAVEGALPDGRRVISVSTARAALAAVNLENVGAAIVDVALSDGSDFDVVGALRTHGNPAPPWTSRRMDSAPYWPPS